MTDRSAAIVTEVGPRDGLQNEAKALSVAERIRFIEALADTGLKRIECGAFVSPRAVPQMANSDAVLAGIRRKPGVCYSALVPNERGLERALRVGVDEIAVFGAASETFTRRNINCSIAESLDRFRPTARAALAAGIPARGYVSCALGCPYEGHIATDVVLRVAEALAEMGCQEIALGDTIGAGTPARVRSVFAPVIECLGAHRVAGHFHDTNGRALDNIRVAVSLGIRRFDGSAGGLGGCPYAPESPGNVSTEDVIRLLRELGYDAEIDPDCVAKIGARMRNLLIH